jgi:hypothetical protein
MEKQKTQDGGKERPNQISYEESWHGPDMMYYAYTHITRNPTPQGLDGGHIKFFNIKRKVEIDYEQAPDLSDHDAHEQWIRNLPGDVKLARYEDGKLTRYADDPLLDEIIEEIKFMYRGDHIREDHISWLDMAEEPRSESAKADTASFESAMKIAAEQEGERDQRRELDRDKDRSR